MKPMKNRNHVAWTAVLMMFFCVSLIGLTGCSEQGSAPKEKSESAESSRGSSGQPDSDAAPEAALDINVAPDFDSISKIIRYADGTPHTIYVEPFGAVPDHVKFSISAVKPNRIWTLAVNGNDIEGFNTEGEWFGSGAQRERIAYGRDAEAKTVIHELRKLQSDMGKPPYELKAVRTMYFSGTGLIARNETVIHGRFPAQDASGLMLDTAFEDLKNLPDTQYTDIRHDVEFK